MSTVTTTAIKRSGTDWTGRCRCRLRRTGAALHVALALTALLTQACAPQSGSLSASAESAVDNELNANNDELATLMSARVQFDAGDFYSATSPNAAGCAGDVMTLYDPIALRSPASVEASPLPTDPNGTASSVTVRPSFIKNVSVDITDANAVTPANQASSCSYGSTGNAASDCATFDYGAQAGIYSNLSASVLLLGGVEGVNTAGVPFGATVACGPSSSTDFNTCAASFFAMGVDTLPSTDATDPSSTLAPGLTSATGPISSFSNLGVGSTSVTMPQDLAASTGAYDIGDNELTVFGGSTVIGALSSSGDSSLTDTTWVYNLNTQAWTQLTVSPTIATTLTETFDDDLGTPFELSNQVSARAGFGYAAAQGFALNAMSQGSATTLSAIGSSPASTPVDLTDQIIIVGGQIGSGSFADDSYRFNPTYAPQWMDSQPRSGGEGAPGANEATQWLINYHTVPLYAAGTTDANQFIMPYRNGSYTSPNTVNFGLVPLRDNVTTDFGAGYVLAMGGFDTTQSSGLNGGVSSAYVDACDNSSSGSNDCGMMVLSHPGRGFSSSASGSENFPAVFDSVANLLFPTRGASNSTELAPALWNAYTGTNGGSPVVPFYGGATLLPGFSLNDNDTVFFGGATCESYLLASTGGCNFANPGRYFHIGTNPMSNASAVTSQDNLAFTGTPPQAAGMAAARGLDPDGHPVIIAFGGMTQAGVGTNPSLFVLYNSGGTNPATPTWTTATVSSTIPAVPTNGALVYSHVTGNFYMFGGFTSATGAYLGDTWKLAFDPSFAGNSACGTAGTCQFIWTQLDAAGGANTTSCFPACPEARRSHRMVEANYNNRAPGTDPAPTCSASEPCSYGIFMEDGTPDGTTLISDRWMFDPTANGGFGLWQKMNEMPARALSAMASADYTPASGTTVAHRAILFGGETGLSDPLEAQTGDSFVAPTLGDTWMYDYDAQTWNRVQLLGVGYNGTPGTGFVGNEQGWRQAYDATQTVRASSTDPRSIDQELTPPPTSGAMMVARTMSGPATSVSPSPLAIPEIYLIGGRLKDGSYQPFDHVYKFCAGSSGEAYSSGPFPASNPNPNDLSCDAFNATTNPFSTSPVSGYVGRWLRKEPSGAGLPSTFSSFMGAAAYDSTQDVIAVYGGLQFTSNTAVTDPTTRSTSTDVFEYTPPNASNPPASYDGSWAQIPPCGGSAVPSTRYGHSMIYDIQHEQLVVIGGYASNGTQLTQTLSNGSVVPDMWRAVKNTAGSCYTWTQIDTIGNSFGGTSAAMPGIETGISHLLAVYVPPTGYGTGYYSMFDSLCVGAGPIESSDPSISKELAGGVYFDIDRTQLGPNENLILNLTFLPLSSSNTGPTGSALSSGDNAIFKIHLVNTGGESADQSESTAQPRYMSYTGNSNYPEIVPSLSVLAPPDGQVRQEQLILPITSDPSIDRIRIERVSGTGILIDAALYRMGYR